MPAECGAIVPSRSNRPLPYNCLLIVKAGSPAIRRQKPLTPSGGAAAHHFRQILKNIYFILFDDQSAAPAANRRSPLGGERASVILVESD